MLKNVGLLLVRCIALLAMFVGWVLIPHYFPGLPGYIGMGVLCAAFITFSYFTREWKYTVSMKEDRQKLLSYMCIAMGICMIAYIFILPGLGLTQNRVVGHTAAGGVLFVVQYEIAAALNSSGENTSKRIQGASLCCIIAVAFNIYIVIGFFGAGFRPFARFLVIALCLAACLIAHFTYKVHMNNHNTEMFWFCCLVVALALTQVVNLQLDTSPGQWKTFTATSYYRRNTDCKLEDGYAFTYPGQNLEIGETGEIQEFEGWFHISYLNPMGE